MEISYCNNFDITSQEQFTFHKPVLWEPVIIHSLNQYELFTVCMLFNFQPENSKSRS